MKKKTVKRILIVVFLLCSSLFVIRFAGLTLLRIYIQTGIGTCSKIPILCMVPQQEIAEPAIDTQYLTGLLPYEFSDIKIYLPKGFTVVNEKIKKFYYKRKQRKERGSAIYLLYEKPGFFVNLYPQLKRDGIKDNREFLRQLMHVRIDQINSLNDAFFVVMKSIFTPNLGDQNNLKMITLNSQGKAGFINYDLAVDGNYFDCNIINSKDDFFKIYIKDKAGALDLDKVLAIISTVRKE